jgi:hemoglobin/transferrin/lactoferrin receptor protein
MTRKMMLVLAGLLASTASAALAADAVEATTDTGEAEAAPLDTITVTATRNPQTVINVPATVNVITAEEIETNLYQDIKDLVRFEPGVSVRTQPARFGAALGTAGRDGNSGFNIRGLGGNRVLMQTDGIRLPDAFEFGAQAVGRGDYADLDLLKSVEILRGPASALYGSDGLAGAVSFFTKDPDDILTANDDFAVRAKLGYAGAADEWTEAVALAGRTGNVQSLVAYTHRSAHATDNQGTNDSADVNRTTPNPQNLNSNAVLAKLLWLPAEGHRLRLTYEYYNRVVDTDVLSGIAVPPLRPTSVVGLTAQDTIKRNRVSLDWNYDGSGLVDYAQVIAYWMDSKTREFTAEDRYTSPDRTRDNTFDNELYGIAGRAELAFNTGSVPNRVTAGFDFSQTLQTGLRDGTVPPAGETFPIRAFPDTDYFLGGLYIQDELQFAGGRLSLYPAVRLDLFSLTPKPDPLFTGPTAEQSDNHISPKFGAIGWLTDSFGLTFSYAAGFKAPTPSQVNNGFSNVIQNYISLPNPDLKPETSSSVEGGVRLRNADVGGVQLSATFAAFYGWYEDFIEQQQVGGNFTPTDPAVFQFVNVGQVEIGGVEARLNADFGKGWGFNFAFAYARGDETQDGVVTPLSTIDPISMVAGLSYNEPDGRYGGQAIVTWAQQKAQDRTGEPCSPACFTPPSFTILDLTAFYRPTDWAIIRAGLFNLFDAKYWWWSDVRGLAANSPVLDAWTQPGRNISASLTVQF